MNDNPQASSPRTEPFPCKIRAIVSCFLFAITAPLIPHLSCAEESEGPVDRIVAVVEDGVILESELQQRVDAIKKKLSESNTDLPPEPILARQVLERMIVDKLQLQMAERSGIRVDDETLRMAVQQIAERNHLSVENFRKALLQEGIAYTGFVEEIRNEIILGRLRSSQINNQIKVTDHEVEHYLETHGKTGVERGSEYLIGHILIAIPQTASPTQIQAAREKAQRLVEELNRGRDFKQTALSVSDDAQALAGGELGWRGLGQIPTVFADKVVAMKEGDIEGPIRSPSGFHIIKLLGVRGEDKHLVTKTHARHILIKPNEVLSDEEARQKLLNLKERVENGEDFAALARAYSDDKGSAIKGGDLGWVEPGALVPPFEEAMNKLATNEISDPVQTQFGWHLIQALERQEQDNTEDYQKTQARDEIFKRKVEEETELWLRRLRDEAYVEIRLDEI
jgi:peptidyl-prolyl cis-trans isomerase SurA